MSHTAIKNNINRLLQERSWRVADLENKIGHGRPVKNILSGSSKNPTIEILQSIAKAFDIEIQELLLDPETQDPVLNVPLLRDTCNKITKELELINCPITVKHSNVFLLIKEIYEYSVQLGLDQADENYIKWVLQKLYKRPPPY